MDSRSRSLLAHLLVGKSIVEALFVSALAVGFFWFAFPPYFQGWGEVTPRTIEGWAIDRQSKTDHIEVQLFIDDRFVATAIANQSRPDVMDAGFTSDPQHGYSFPIPPLSPGEHVARVYAIHSSGNAVRKTLQLVGKPM